MNNWRTVTDLVAYVPLNQECVYFSVPDKKSYQLAVTKNIEGYFNETHIDVNEFELKISRSSNKEYDYDYLDPALYVRSPQLPDSTIWYRVENYDGNLINIISQLNCEKGIFTGYIFEAVFCEDNPSGVAFCCREMIEYKKCLAEMSRRINCDLYKKTKTWIPGHRYDTIKDTVYYLATVKSRRVDNSYSEFTEDSSKCPRVHLVVKNLRDTDKSISDILNTRTFGTGEDDIQVLETMSSRVDSGESLVNDYTKYEDYLKYLVPNSIKKCEIKEKYGYTKYESPKTILDNFCYFDEPSVNYSTILQDDGNSIIDSVTKVIGAQVFDCILNTWNLNKFRKDLNIGSKNTLEENKKALSMLFPSCFISDGNSLKYIYYTGLFKHIGLDFEDIISKCLVNWDENQVVYDKFDDFIKYLFYTRLRNQSHLSTQRVNSTNHPLDIVTIKDVFGDSELTNSLVDLLEQGRQGYGCGISSFNIVNIGTRKEPKEFINATVTLDDLIKFKSKKGESELSESLKYDILINKFCSLAISFDRTGEIK